VAAAGRGFDFEKRNFMRLCVVKAMEGVDLPII